MHNCAFLGQFANLAGMAHIVDVIVLPAILCEPIISEAAQFCIDVAHHCSSPTDIWILGGKAKTKGKLAGAFPELNVEQFQLDRAVWPADLGSNQMLKLPILLKETCLHACETKAIKSIYIPLYGAGGYFLEMAIQAGILPRAPKIVTTCYSPLSFELSGSLTLPSELSEIVTCEMESICAKQSEEFWVPDTLVKDTIMETLGLKEDKVVQLLPRSFEFSSKSASLNTRHIIFCGALTPVNGIDAFCDLAEDLDKSKKLDKVTIITPSNDDRWSKATRARLFSLGAALDWKQKADVSRCFNSLSPGIFIYPMRAPILPTSIFIALKSGMPCIWGQGFNLLTSKSEINGLHFSVSDARKIKTVLENIETPSVRSSLLPAQTFQPQLPQKNSQPCQVNPIERLSVIVIHHNRADKLKQALYSLYKQTYADFEVIVVDDGSSDVSAAELKVILDEFDFQASQFHQIENSYPSAARNHGAYHATGDALFFVDDDNVLDPRALEAFLGALQSRDLVLSFYQTFRGDTPPSLEKSETIRPSYKGLSYGFAGLLPGPGLFHNVLGNSSFMIRKHRFLELGGFSPKYGVGLEDYSFLLKAGQQQGLRWIMLPEPYLHFRLHPQKIRNTHVDWKGHVRLQAGHWRLMEDLKNESLRISPYCLAYARQLHELTQYSFVHSSRPKFFRLKSVFLHQYIRPFLARNIRLRTFFNRFSGNETRLAKWVEKFITK